MASKTIEELEAEMNMERVQRNQRMIEKMESLTGQERPRPKRKVFGKLLLVLCLILAALLFLAWMVLQRTNIYIGLGAVAIPGLTG